MKAEVKDIKGAVVKTIDIPEDIYGVELNDHLLHSVVKGYQANRRQGTHATKTRAFVSGGGKKPFKQKGTGSARQGTSRSPLMPGGAIVHGPQPRDYRQKLNRKATQLALKIALSDKVKAKKFTIINDFAISKCNTKHILGALKALKADSALLLDERKDDLLHKSSRNIYKVRALLPGEVNAEHVLRHENLVISETALTALNQRLKV